MVGNEALAAVLSSRLHTARETRRASVVGALLPLLFMALPARAALFDDEEARRRIEATRIRLEQTERTLSSRLDALEQTVKNQGLVDLFRDVEQIKSDIARLRGQQEVLTYELEQAQKRQRDLYLDLDSRLRKLESVPAPAAAPAVVDPAVAPVAPGAPGAPGAIPPAASPGAATPPAASAPAVPGAARPASAPGDAASEQRTYDAALDQFKSGNYSAAAASFQAFVRSYPRSPLAASALYWAGNANYAQKDFRGAISTQRQLLAAYPDSQKVPDALLNIASSQVELGDVPGSRRTLEEIVARHPTSEAAVKARQRLSGR